MKETPFKDKLLYDLNAIPDAYFFKYHATSYSAGVPDLLGALDAQAYAIEAKVFELPKKGTTLCDITKDVRPNQLHKMEIMSRGSWTCFIVVLLNPVGRIIWLPWDTKIVLSKDVLLNLVNDQHEFWMKHDISDLRRKPMKK